jgi:2,3,4,5-tetrahydropyridine-2-carboxylate N-succinyltransferase
MKTKEEFSAFVNEIQSHNGYQKPQAFALGLKRSRNGKVLDVYFPHINWDTAFGTAALFANVLNIEFGVNKAYTINLEQLNEVYHQFTAFHEEMHDHPNIVAIHNFLQNFSNSHDYYQNELVVYFSFDHQKDVQDAVEGYFKLQAISQRCVLPHGTNLTGIFGKLTNVAWTNKGPVLPEELSAQISKHICSSPIEVSHVDKFPYLVNYHIPSGVRIASGSQVRLGAYLGEGTTVMPAGYINFNAGTRGNAMVEGRISAGVVVDEDSDVGGGASIMGTLSGGNQNVISIGKKCLLGANSGTGISLGDGCTIAAGVYVTAGAKVSLYNEKNEPVNSRGDIVAEGQNTIKAIELNGADNLLFINDSKTGKLVCKPNMKAIELNAALHAND